MSTETMGYDYIDPSNYWVWDENEDGSSVARNLLPIDTWECYECQAPIGWQTWHTNTYIVTRWADVYADSGKDICDIYTTKICADCNWAE